MLLAPPVCNINHYRQPLRQEVENRSKGLILVLRYRLETVAKPLKSRHHL